MLRASSSAEQVIAQLASRQHGVVTRAQLLNAGVSADVVARRVAGDRLRPVHRGVYLAVAIVPPLAGPMAAVLACGEGAAVSHLSAAAIWELLSIAKGGDPVDVIVAKYRRRPGIRIHRVRALAADEVTKYEGISITTPARTLLDLAATVGQRDLEQAVARAERGDLAKRTETEAVLDRHPGHRGARRLRSLLERIAEPALTRSEAEERLLDLVRRSRLPQPRVNVRVEGYEVDFYWPAERLVVEVDGYSFHASPRTFERDRMRDGVLAAAGLRVMRVTWRQIEGEPVALIARISQALVRGTPG